MFKKFTFALLSSAALMSASVAGTALTSNGPVTPNVATAAACSGGISYDNIGANWNHAFVDGNVDDVDSVGIDFSKTIVDRLYFRGKGYYNNAGDSGWSDWSASAGLGYAFALANNLDFVTEAGALFDSDDNGWYIFPHLRGKISCLELHAGAKYQDWNGYRNWEAVVTAFYEVIPHVDLSVGGIFGEGDSQFRSPAA